MTGTRAQNRIDEQAANWVVRLENGGLADSDGAALNRWLEADKAHGVAFAEARAAWQMAASLAVERRSAPPAPPTLGRATGRTRRMLRGAAGMAIAASLLIAAGIGSGHIPNPYVDLVADAKTAPGEIETVTLPDGSIAELGPDSAIRISYDAAHRSVTLLRGSGYFEVRPTGTGEEKRAFTVEAKNGNIRALGTAFMVERLPDSVEVTAIQHRIRIALDGDAAENRVLTPGHAVLYGESGFGTIVQRADDQALAWRRGRLIFDRAPFSRVIDSLDRYRRGTIVIANRALAGRTVSGMFDTANPDKVLDRIARDMGATRVTVTPYLTLLF